MTTEWLHKKVFYYENNEYLMKYRGTMSILPKGAVAPAHSQCLSALFSLKLRLEVAAVRLWHSNSFIFRSPPRAIVPHKKKWGFLPAHMLRGPLSNLFSLRPVLARRCEYLKCFLAVSYNTDHSWTSHTTIYLPPFYICNNGTSKYPDNCSML
jgi:hypothetical protein